MPKFETVVVETDLLIVGGGMAACGAAVEAAYWAQDERAEGHPRRQGRRGPFRPIAMGLSAINQYVGLKDGANTVKDYVDYVRNDLMGITREDLVANMPATSIPPCTCSKSGACRSGRTRTATMFMKAVGSS